MSKAVFTPGPWWIDDVNDSSYVFAGKGLMIAEMRGWGWGAPINENARLIAAAPEMAEALKSLLAAHETLLADYETNDRPDMRGKNPDCIFARAALQKAGLL